MGRSPCCEKEGLKKGPWTPEEDQKLLTFIEEHGHGSWRALPAKAGLQRCGKSCRLRWINYLRPDIKRGKFTLREEQTIIQLHALLGNRWSAIASHLPKRTDNEIKNYWNTHLKKKLNKMGIDPATHKPKTDGLGSASSPKDAANLSHMAQWESARLEAEARLVRESKVLIPPQTQPGHSSSTVSKTVAAAAAVPLPRLQCLDVLKAWQGVVTGMFAFGTNNLDSPTSTLNFLENNTAIPISTVGFNENLFGSSDINVPNEWKSLQKSSNQLEELEEKMENSMAAAAEMHADQEITYTNGDTTAWFLDHSYRAENLIEGYGDEMLVCEQNGGNQNYNVGYGGGNSGDGFDQEKYWNSIASLESNSPAGSPVF